MMGRMLLPVYRRAGLKDKFFYSNFQESSNFAYKRKVKEMKVIEGAGYRPDPKCTWNEAVTVYWSTYDLSPTDCHLAVTASSWSGMNRKERERHLAKLGTSITEDIKQDNKEGLLTQTEVFGGFKDSGLSEFELIPGW